MRSSAARVAAVAAALAVLLAVAVGYVVHAAQRGESGPSAADDPGAAGTPAGDVGSVTSAGPYYVFKSSALNRDFGRVAVAPASDTARRVFVAGLRCNRLAFAHGHGLCLQLSRSGVTVDVDASVLDATMTVTGHVRLAGYPSRTMIAPDGRLAAATTFVSGDSYASMGFSTRTSIIDLAGHDVLFDLEKLSVTKGGQPFHASDFNFWGVTFQADSRHFFATLGSGGQTYLIHGDLETRSAVVVTSGVECPSLSPDGKLIAFKKRVADNPVAWHLWILDVASGQEHATSETRPVDDQPAWLDDRTVMYGLAVPDGDQSGLQQSGSAPPAVAAGASIDTNMWAVPADGSGTARLALDHAWSAQLVPSSTRSAGP